MLLLDLQNTSLQVQWSQWKWRTIPSDITMRIGLFFAWRGVRSRTRLKRKIGNFLPAAFGFEAGVGVDGVDDDSVAVYEGVGKVGFRRCSRGRVYCLGAGARGVYGADSGRAWYYPPAESQPLFVRRRWWGWWWWKDEKKWESEEEGKEREYSSALKDCHCS